jgi:hypothetical protein
LYGRENETKQLLEVFADMERNVHSRAVFIRWVVRGEERGSGKKREKRRRREERGERGRRDRREN